MLPRKRQPTSDSKGRCRFLQDARAYLTDKSSGVSTIVVNAFEPLQAYLGLHDTGEEPFIWELRLGRQTMDLGGRRLVARNRFRDTIQNYTGATLDLKYENTKLTAFSTPRAAPRAIGASIPRACALFASQSKDA